MQRDKADIWQGRIKRKFQFQKAGTKFWKHKDNIIEAAMKYVPTDGKQWKKMV
jgi:SPX domain protein involved in polyphosphate accumulation